VPRRVDSIKYRPNDGYEYRWNGVAPYIERFRIMGTSDIVYPLPDIEVISVWDYTTQTPTIARTCQAMANRIQAWLTEQR
jgi:hypothetical protein